jgi:hypothetical protein
MIILLVMALSVAACTEAAESSSTTTTTVAAPTTSGTTATTAPEATEPTETAATTESTTTTTAGPVVTVIDIVVMGGTVERVERFDVPLDGAVRVAVTADVSDEIHLHGYDLHADVTPDTGAVFEFDATIPGVFEIELEGSGVLIGELQVAP